MLYSCISTAVHRDGQATAPPNDAPIVVASPPGGPRYPGADRDVSRANSEGRGYAPRARQLVVGRPSPWTAAAAAIEGFHADDGCYGPLVSRYRTAHAISGWSGTVDPRAVIMTTPAVVSTKVLPPTRIARRPSPATASAPSRAPKLSIDGPDGRECMTTAAIAGSSGRWATAVATKSMAAGRSAAPLRGGS